MASSDGIELGNMSQSRVPLLAGNNAAGEIGTFVGKAPAASGDGYVPPVPSGVSDVSAAAAPASAASAAPTVQTTSGGEMIERGVASMGVVASESPKSTLFIVSLFIIVYIMWIISVYVLQGSATGNKYLLISAIIISALLVITLVTTFVSLSMVLTALSMVLFIWYAVDTYKTYKSSGQTGMANVQVLMMVSLLVTIILGKFVFADGGGFPEMVSIFCTIVSFCLIYLINNLSEQMCPKPEETHYKEMLAHAAFFIFIFSLTGKHALIALAISVAAFAYFSYAAKNVKSGDGGDGGDGDGASNEKVNLGITTFLIMFASLKIMFPSFSITSITNSRPVQIFVNILTVCAMLSFLMVNVLYSMNFSKKTIMGYLVGVNCFVAFIMVIRGFM